ncbi:MAG: hypothetical protein AABZ27_00830, partial [Candidatus Omnitrophota bacterium]
SSPVTVKATKELTSRAQYLSKMKISGPPIVIRWDPHSDALPEVNNPDDLRNYIKEVENAQRELERLKNMPIPSDPEEYLELLKKINPTADYDNNGITPAILETARKNLERYLSKYPKYLRKFLRKLEPAAIRLAARGAPPLIPETERPEFYRIGRGFKVIRGVTKDGQGAEYYWIQATNREYGKAKEARENSIKNIPFMPSLGWRRDDWKDQRWRLYLNPQPGDFAYMARILKRPAVKFEGPLEYKYLDEKTYNKRQKNRDFTQKINDPKITKIVVNFILEEDAIRFYEILREDPEYQKLKSGLGPSDYARPMDNIASIAQGYVETRRARNDLKPQSLSPEAAGNEFLSLDNKGQKVPSDTMKDNSAASSAVEEGEKKLRELLSKHPKLKIEHDLLKEFGVGLGTNILEIGIESEYRGTVAAAMGAHYRQYEISGKISGFSFREYIDSIEIPGYKYGFSLEKNLSSHNGHVGEGTYNYIRGEFSGGNKSVSNKIGREGYVENKSQDIIIAVTGALSDPIPESNAHDILREMLRVLKPGGMLVVGTYGSWDKDIGLSMPHHELHGYEFYKFRKVVSDVLKEPEWRGKVLVSHRKELSRQNFDSYCSFDVYKINFINSSPFENNNSNTVNSSSSSLLASSDKGGIDFHALPIQIESVASSALGLFSALGALKGDLDAEWSQIQAIFNSGIRPSIQRISEYTAAAAASPLAEGKIDQVRVMLADILRRDEESERLTPAEESCKQLLRTLESG